MQYQSLLPHVKWIFPHAYVAEPTRRTEDRTRQCGLGPASLAWHPMPRAALCRSPHRPKRPITLNGGHVMPGWYDIISLDRDEEHDGPGLAASAQYGPCRPDHPVPTALPQSQPPCPGPQPRGPR